MILLQFFYNLLFPLAFLFLMPFYLPRMFRRGGYQDQFAQRFGIFDQEAAERIGQGRFWIHAVSVGETFIALKFIRQFRKRHPDTRFILSVTTTTALAIANKEASEWLEPIANPLDFFLVTNSLIRRFRPVALIMVEGDIWVQRVLQCKRKLIPTALITARLSSRSESRFQKFSWVIAPFFNLLDVIGVPTLKDQQRWEALGIKSSHLQVTGNIKFDQKFPSDHKSPGDADNVFSSLGWQKQDPIFLAGSTYDIGEEEVIVKAWQALRGEFPNLRLIVAPRHAERREELRMLFNKLHLKAAFRSEDIISPAEAFVLDTTGELNAWYTLATIVFVGKSLGIGAARGGQNPIEPLAHGKPVLVGPYMNNFEPVISELLALQGVLQVRDEEEIVQSAKKLLLNPQVAADLVRHGGEALQQHQGATERSCSLIESLFIA